METACGCWAWREDDKNHTAACVEVPIGRDAVELTALVVYTDVLYVYTDVVPEDGPGVMASWDARREAGRWHVTMREEVGLGAVPDMEPWERAAAAQAVREMIQQRSGGRYTLVERFNIGKKDPRNGHVIEYDSGFDIVAGEAGKTR